MTETLLQAYVPLLFWPGLGLLLFRFLPDTFPRFLGRGLYWVGIPLEIFTLARQTDFTGQFGIAPLVTVTALTIGLGLGWVGLKGLQWLQGQSQARSASSDAPEHEPVPGLPSVPASRTWDSRARQGSLLLSSMLGNTGFVGLAIAPALISDERYLSWVVFYSITHNLLGTYGIGVWTASHFGRLPHTNHWWLQVRDVLTVPSLWGFIIGFCTRSVPLPQTVESSLHGSIWFIIPAALLLMGMRLSQLNGWNSLRLALVPSLIKVLLVPCIIGIGTIPLHLATDAHLALVLMSGMPTAFAGLILAEEYELDRELIASSIVISTGTLLLAIPLWLAIFGDRLPLNGPG